jgi:hypothetical protein
VAIVASLFFGVVPAAAADAAVAVAAPMPRPPLDTTTSLAWMQADMMSSWQYVGIWQVETRVLSNSNSVCNRINKLIRRYDI